MVINELNPEVPEVKEQGEDVETVDADFESELDGKYDEYLKRKKQRRTLTDAQ